MANCLNYDCTDALGDHTLNSCGEELLAGIDAGVLLECNHQLTDPSNGTQIAAEIAAGRATLVKNIKVGIAKPSPVTVESNVACATPKLVTYDRAGTWVDGNVNSNNVTFYDGVLGGRSFGGIIFHLCGTAEADAGEKVMWIDADVRFTGGHVIPNTNNEFQTFDSDFNWRKKGGNMLYANPVGIFT
jgi:hypothetical protein